MTNDLTSDGRAVVDRIRAENIEVPAMEDYGWPGAVELAVIDAVLSIRARYGTRTTGVLGSVHRYRDRYAGSSIDDLNALKARDRRQLESIFGLQRSARRLKSDIIVDVAARLVAEGVVHAADVRPDDDQQRRAWTDTKGLGWVTWEYFTMLVGQPGVKADTMVTRFVAGAVEEPAIESKRAHAAVVVAASELGVNPRDLDHALWRFQSGRAPRRA